ncbi:MAG TPA: tetratricopeptide repeat protein [Verrucomicrobiae bacterium]|nr:tetratricopeptide repeat protein [Verrucomicrobiae bacterium]
MISAFASAGVVACRRDGERVRRLGELAAVLVLALLGVSTWKQAHVYRDLETLWRDTLAKNPSAWIAHNNLSDILMQQGKIEEAAWHLEQALPFKPDATAHYNLGLALARLGRLQDAIGHYEQALRLHPDYAEADCDLGVALARTGRTQEAVPHFERALKMKPDYVGAHDNLGVAFVHLGRVDEAKAQWERALQLKPDDAEAHANLGNALKEEGRFETAILHYEQALRIDPNLAGVQRSFGNILAQTGRLQEAMEHWEQALRIKPDSPDVGNDLAWMYATLPPAKGGNPAQAVRLAERACGLSNNRVAEYLDTLAAAYAAAGRLGDAVATAQKAISLARSEGRMQLAGEIETRLDLYRARREYRASVSGTNPQGP